MIPHTDNPTLKGTVFDRWAMKAGLRIVGHSHDAQTDSVTLTLALWDAPATQDLTWSIQSPALFRDQMYDVRNQLESAKQRTR